MNENLYLSRNGEIAQRRPQNDEREKVEEKKDLDPWKHLENG